MTFIDWSDSEGLLGLLIEFVADAKNESIKDAGRQRFLTKLLLDLNALNGRFDTLPPAEAIAQLRSIQDSVDEEFREDPVTEHIRDLIQELET